MTVKFIGDPIVNYESETKAAFTALDSQRNDSAVNLRSKFQQSNIPSDASLDRNHIMKTVSMLNDRAVNLS